MKQPREVYLAMFMGQSNMAGRGVAAKAPLVPLGSAYEFKAITQPDTLTPLQEPFGEMENDPDGVYEPGMKTGSMVSAFANAFEEVLPVPLVGVSCAKGGSSIREWQPGEAYYRDAVRRCHLCRSYLDNQGIAVAGRFMVWCQGCTDGDLRTDPDLYREQTERTLSAFMAECSLDTCFFIQIGNHRDDPNLYVPIQEAQMRLVRECPWVVLVSQQFKTFARRWLMKDEFHYLQEGYNLIGEETGRNAAQYLSQHFNEKGA